MKKSSIFLTAAVLLWMVLIFMFSAQPADTSTETSHAVGMKIGSWFVPGFDEWSRERQISFAAAIDYPVRKGAHASEYALLAILLAGMAASFRENGKTGVFPFWTASVYAASDEFHQLFVPGRSGQVSDVLLDMAGAAAGFLLFHLVRKIIRSIRRSD